LQIKKLPVLGYPVKKYPKFKRISLPQRLEDTKFFGQDNLPSLKLRHGRQDIFFKPQRPQRAQRKMATKRHRKINH
jgi:hypothetical protein